VVDAARESDARARVAELEREVRSLTAKLERNAAELAATTAGSGVSRIDTSGDAERFRLRLREQGNRIRELQQRLDTGTARTAELVAGAEAERDRARAEAEAWRQRAEAASARADTATEGLQRMRASVVDSRAASDRRLELLLGTLEGAASGLRREWDLIGGGPAPADVVAARLPRQATEAERTADPARLTTWAGLPNAHLIVDGYNVTKTGFGELSLSDQRDRLVRSLGALAARTSAEVTVVFDGAAVATARPPARGIRVLFSPPGVVADHVIRDLVRAEPLGRVVIVVSSDREVVDRAAADGARTAPSVALLAALGG
jgi:YacP-like NYN domain